MAVAARIDLTGSGTELEQHHRQLCAAQGGRDLQLASFDAAAHLPADLEAARRFWQRRMTAEHRSVQVFLHLAAQLIEIGATLDVTTVMVRLAQDELRHTEICGQLVVALGGDPSIEVAEIRPLARHPGCTPLERVVRNVIYATCMSEMVATARQVDALEHTSDETARAVTRSILADEVLHGTYGFHFLDAQRSAIDAEPALRASLATYCRHAFAVLEREMDSPLRGRPRPTGGAMALGVIDPVRAIEVFHGTITHAIIPGLERHGIAAGEAWRTRQLLA